MKNLVMGIFDSREAAESAINELKQMNYGDKISVIMKDETVGKQITEDTGVETDVSEDVGKGALTGGVIGGLAGLLIGAGVVAFPPVAGIALAGPIASALGVSTTAASTIAGAGVGAGVGGLAGALTSLGVSEADAQIYSEHITQRNGILVTTEAREGESEEVKDIFVDNGAAEVRVTQ